MSTPIDLTDALKTPPTPPPSGGRKGRESGRGAGARLDDYARPVLWVALALSVLLLIYLGWGLFGGAWADPGWTRPGGVDLKHSTLHAYRQHQLANIGLVFALLRVMAVVIVLGLLICSLRDEGAGYALLGVAAALYFGLPLLTGQIYIWQTLRATEASSDVFQQMQSLALLYGVPGLIWTAIDVVRRLRLASEAAAIQRANLKYTTPPQGRSLSSKARSRLTPHQRQYRTYQILAVVIMVAEPLIVLVNLDTIKLWVGQLLIAIENVTNRFSLSPTPGGIAPLHDSSGDLILWTLLIALNMILISQALRLLEYICFRRPT